jgi:hypothetical protein
MCAILPKTWRTWACGCPTLGANLYLGSMNVQTMAQFSRDTSLCGVVCWIPGSGADLWMAKAPTASTQNAITPLHSRFSIVKCDYSFIKLSDNLLTKTGARGVRIPFLGTTITLAQSLSVPIKGRNINVDQEPYIIRHTHFGTNQKMRSCWVASGTPTLDKSHSKSTFRRKRHKWSHGAGTCQRIKKEWGEVSVDMVYVHDLRVGNNSIQQRYRAVHVGRRLARAKISFFSF